MLNALIIKEFSNTGLNGNLIAQLHLLNKGWTSRTGASPMSSDAIVPVSGSREVVK